MSFGINSFIILDQFKGTTLYSNSLIVECPPCSRSKEVSPVDANRGEHSMSCLFTNSQTELFTLWTCIGLESYVDRLKDSRQCANIRHLPFILNKRRSHGTTHCSIPVAMNWQSIHPIVRLLTSEQHPLDWLKIINESINYFADSYIMELVQDRQPKYTEGDQRCGRQTNILERVMYDAF